MTAVSLPPLADFGQLQARYQGMRLAARAQAVLADAQPALRTAESVLEFLSPQGKTLFSALRQNAALLGKLRASEAKNQLLDSSSDFLDDTRRKIAAWQKTMERLGSGEDISVEGGKEYISSQSALALAIAGSASASQYLSIVQLALMDLAKQDAGGADACRSKITELRRCITVLSDCENASGISALVH